MIDAMSRTDPSSPSTERFFAEETEEEKRRCAYQNNMGYTRVSQETCVF